MKKLPRNLGIDTLRIVSMVGVVFLHVLRHGGILNLELSPASYLMAMFFEILAYPAVNCFVLISGYVGYKGEDVFPKIKNILSLMFTVIFYSVAIFLVFTLLGVEPFGLGKFVKSFFPITSNSYWFFSVYFGLFLISPLLNMLVQKINLKYAVAFLSAFSLFIIISIFYDIFSLQNGYSLIWFIFMYLIGAIVKKFKLNELLSKTWWLIIALLSFMITWISKVALEFSSISFLEYYINSLVKYVSPTIVLMAVALLCLFSKIKCNPLFIPIISFFASSAFSVYLIHDNIYIRNYLISKIHTFVGDFNFVSLSLSIVCSVAVIFLACILIDKIRIIIFKAIRIDKLTEKIEKLIITIINAIYTRIEKIIQPTAE